MSFNFVAAVTICSDFGAQKIVCYCFHCFLIYLPWSGGLDAMILVFRMLSFKPTFSLSCFTFIKRFFSSSSLSAIRVVSSAYLQLRHGLWGDTPRPRAEKSQQDWVQAYFQMLVQFMSYFQTQHATYISKLFLLQLRLWEYEIMQKCIINSVEMNF